MSEDILDKILEEKENKLKEQPIAEKEISNGDKQDVQVDNKEIVKEPVVDDVKQLEVLEKDLNSVKKALNDTKRSYQTTNQKLVLSNKKFKSTLEELKNTILDPDNSYLDEDEFKTAVNKLSSIFEFKDEELEINEEVVKTDNKSKTILDKLETEFENYKKYNKSDKELDVNYKAFYDSVHLLNIDERQNLLEYLEEASPTDAVQRIIMLGQDYRNLFEKGLKKHKNIFNYVSNLHEEISKLNEEINKYKLSVDNSFDKNDNKQIKHRSSPIDYNKKQGNDLLSYIMDR